jgi:hypothetical protein
LVLTINVALRSKAKMKKTPLCSEDDCYGKVDLDPEIGDVVVKKDGTYYEPSLKCLNCRTDQDRKKIKRKRKEVRKQLREIL